jgi:hypothetical protein
VDLIASLIRTHFDLGGTQINMNIMDREKVLAAHKDPRLYPDLVVRVTGFSAYFASLSPAFRQLVVDRIMAESWPSPLGRQVCHLPNARVSVAARAFVLAGLVTISQKDGNRHATSDWRACCGDG